MEGGKDGRQFNARRVPFTLHSSLFHSFTLPPLLLPPHQPYGHITHDLEAGRAHLVDGVIRSVPGGIVEVDHIDGTDAGLLKLDMVIDERVSRGSDEVPAITEVLGR